MFETTYAGIVNTERFKQRALLMSTPTTAFCIRARTRLMDARTSARESSNIRANISTRERPPLYPNKHQ